VISSSVDSTRSSFELRRGLRRQYIQAPNLGAREHQPARGEKTQGNRVQTSEPEKPGEARNARGPKESRTPAPSGPNRAFPGQSADVSAARSTDPAPPSPTGHTKAHLAIDSRVHASAKTWTVEQRSPTADREPSGNDVYDSLSPKC
jgi:hypothetical protein